MTRSTPVLAASIAVAVLLTATGCGAPAGSAVPPGGAAPSVEVSNEAAPPSATAEPTAPPTSTTRTTTAHPSPSGDATATEASTPTPEVTQNSDPEPPYRKLPGSFERVAVVAEVYPIRRGNATSTANIRFRQATSGSEYFRIHKSLNDHNPELGDKEETAPDGFRLIDRQTKKAYLPATIGDRECLCSPRVNGFSHYISDVTVTVTFAAPPASITTIDLVVPGFGTVNDVPLH
jgi:hypothetical protein